MVSLLASARCTTDIRQGQPLFAAICISDRSAALKSKGGGQGGTRLASGNRQPPAANHETDRCRSGLTASRVRYPFAAMSSNTANMVRVGSPVPPLGV